MAAIAASAQAVRCRAVHGQSAGVVRAAAAGGTAGKLVHKSAFPRAGQVGWKELREVCDALCAQFGKEVIETPTMLDSDFQVIIALTYRRNGVLTRPLQA